MDYFFWIGILILFILFIIASYLYVLKTRLFINTIKKKENFQNQFNNSLKYYRRQYDNPYILNQNNLWLSDNNEWFNYLNSYWIYMTTPNIMARGFINLDDMKKKYRDFGIQIINDNEKKYIVNEITTFMRYFQNRYRFTGLYLYLDYWLSKIMIAKASNWLEEGMPHTHNKVIILNPKNFISFSLNTFIHELSHIHQRKYPDDWYKLLSEWGFIHYDFNLEDSSGLENILIRNRTNPDGLDIHWIWKSPNNKYYWIGAIYQNINPNSLTNNIEYNAYQLTMNNGKFIYLSNNTPISLNNFKDYQDYFNINKNNYHPNEIISQYMEFYLEDIKNKNELRKKNIPAYNIFYNYLENIIFPKYI